MDWGRQQSDREGRQRQPFWGAYPERHLEPVRFRECIAAALLRVTGEVGYCGGMRFEALYQGM